MTPALVGAVPANQIYVDGVWREVSGSFADVNPHNEEVFANAPDGTVDDMSDAIAAARRAADSQVWSRTSIADRAKVLNQIADAIERNVSALAELGNVEWGMTANEQGFHVDSTILALREVAELAEDALAEQDISKPAWGLSAFTLRKPHGVVASITPWNFPFQLNVMKLGPALVAGNTFVLKPSPFSPYAALALAKLIDDETDLPPGVFNVVTTTSDDAAKLLTTDPRVDMISFVGSTATAKHVMIGAAQSMKRILFELGGKSAAIYLEDADYAPNLDTIAFGSNSMHAGQACILHSRQLVHRSRYDEFVDLFGARVKATKVGDPRDPANEMGPLINAASRDRVQGMVDRAVAQGARLVTGGGRPADQPTGFYFEPTVLADVDNSWEIAQEEVFGPVTAVIPFDTEDEAIALANDSRYGLVGTVHTSDPERAKAVARRIDAGCVSVNGGPPFGHFGGTKQSGIGREGGIVGIQTFTDMKSVSWFG